MIGLFNLMPPKAKVSFVYGTDIEFQYFETKDDNKTLSHMQFIQKLLALGGEHTLSTMTLRDQIILT